MKVVKLNKNNLNQAIANLKKGRLIIYPTETCYGLGADATNPEAVQKLLAYKGEHAHKPISVAVADRQMAEKYVTLNDTARNLYRHFLPGPLTVISKSRNKLAPALQAGGETLGIRIPDYPLVLALIRRLGRPITATSANTSGQKPPYSHTDWQKYTSTKKQARISLFGSAGRLAKHEPSTVVETTLNETAVLRQGAINLTTPTQTFISKTEAETQQIAQKILAKSQLLAGGHSPTAEELLGSLSSSSDGVRRTPPGWNGKAPCLLFALQGQLGAGKTQFAKGLAQALAIKANISSPTFNLIKEYPFDHHTFYHLDTWRLEKGEELLDLGLEKMIKPGNVIAIEWLQKVRGILEKLEQDSSSAGKIKIIWVTIETLSPTKRRIKYQE